MSPILIHLTRLINWKTNIRLDRGKNLSEGLPFMLAQKNLNITLISNNILTPQYLTALETFRIGQSMKVVNADEAIIKGHRKILDPSVKNLISKDF